MLALVRAPSPRLLECELVHLSREPIDLARVRAQHTNYCEALRKLGCTVVELPETPDLPDGVFVEDTAVVLDEIAIVTRPGAPSRRQEVDSVEAELFSHRSIARIEAPGTIDGGDVLLVGTTIYVGASSRTNATGIEQLRQLTAPHGYDVTAVEVTGCLHLKSAATRAGRDTVLLNPDLVDSTVFSRHDSVPVDPAEPMAANVVVVGDSILASASFPATNRRLREHGFLVETVASDELAKAEGALTCCSLLVP